MIFIVNIVNIVNKKHMKQYRYILDKSSRKYICPKCQKKTFVKYVDTELNSYLSNEFGRCDREAKCGLHKSPKGLICTSTQVIELNPSFHSFELVKQSLKSTHSNNFIKFLESIFSADEVDSVVSRYFIGTSKFWRGATVFWQIDSNQRVRNGKVMLYNDETGKRMKRNDGRAYINNIRSILNLKNFNIKQCLFGLHLVNRFKENPIAIVESEKTAIIMSLFKPEFVWMATGMKHGFNFEMLDPIKQKRIVAFPDKSEYNDWLKKANELNMKGFNIIVNEWIEKTNFKEGTDLADVFLEALK